MEPNHISVAPILLMQAVAASEYVTRVNQLSDLPGSWVLRLQILLTLQQL